ncbi:MAG TPA: hypothetical protein VMR62_25080 [Bryobacteraceae bacterium]|nr:hypothetical protein [Bryobacteraceae bacterium]
MKNRWLGLVLTAFTAILARGQDTAPPSPQTTAQQDHQQMMDQLHITKLRPGADGNHPDAPNAANYDEAKANPYPKLPDPLVLNNGKKVKTAKVWWSKRRPEIVEDFDREVYGRVPQVTPKVSWESTSTAEEKQGDVPVITKKLIGHVDNSAYPAITVNIGLTLTTPANTGGPVPVIMEFSFVPPPGRALPPQFAAAAAAWQQQVLAKGWGYAILIPTTVQADNGAGLTQGIIGLVNKGQPRKPDDWGALRAWAWGASRALDYFETDKAVDARQVGIEGLSRYGKAAIVAMAYDQRFAIGFIASSGEGGAKLHRRNYGEIVENVAGKGDAWVDARGMFLAAVGAGPVYRLLGKKDLGTTEMPPIETALIEGDVAFRQHSDGHSAGPNWPTFIEFASRYLKASAAVKVTALLFRGDLQCTP